jgi:hypothetical protein
MLQASIFYDFQALLNHRANACSCFDLSRGGKTGRIASRILARAKMQWKVSFMST